MSRTIKIGKKTSDAFIYHTSKYWCREKLCSYLMLVIW